jgi:RNA polymerase sigma-70 factor, ECF subfamily
VQGVSADEIERVYRERYVGFRNALVTVTGSRESARDAVQEAFARALRHREQHRGGSLEAWIFRIALRAALESRRNGREVRLEDAVDPELPEPQRDPELAAALRELSPRRRLIVFLRYFADLSYAEIAEVCGISEGTVAAALAQAKAALQETLENEEVKTWTTR